MSLKRLEPQRFSAYFNIKATQLGFVDIYAHQDIPLFLDPFGIAAMRNDWSRKCESQIATYFQYLLDSINRGDKKTVSRLLNALHEVDEIALGYSSKEPRGRGIGKLQAQDIQNAFETSEAAKSGDIKDIADCALLIPGISRDKISDITANILKRQLILFTQEQCRLHSIPMSRVPVNNAFDYEQFEFVSYYDELPVINGRPKILLPIRSVRMDPELSKDKYYRNFVIEFLRAEHQHAGDALATVLRNGNIVVRINDLKEKYPMDVDFLYHFSKEHPQILNKYKEELRSSALKQGGKAQLQPQRRVLNSVERKLILDGIKPGNNDAGNFHKLIFDNLIQIFGHRLSRPFREREINEGRKRIDIVFDNIDKKGFFHHLNTVHHVKCPRILIECKNYGKEIGNPEIDQLIARSSTVRGKFGMLFCRSIDDRPLISKRCKDALYHQQVYILVFTDQDIEILLSLRDKHDEPKIDEFLQNKLDELIM